MLEGDVSFVHWIEQYQFVSDNDTMTITTSGATVSLLTGGNAALNIANFLGIGMQYDLIIVGGNVLDMNIISQIAVLYDNDWARANPDAPDGATISPATTCCGTTPPFTMSAATTVSKPCRTI